MNITEEKIDETIEEMMERAPLHGLGLHFSRRQTEALEEIARSLETLVHDGHGISSICHVLQQVNRD